MALGLTPEQIIEKGAYPLLEISSRWKRVKIKSIAKVQNGFAFSSNYFNKENGLPLIRIRDISKEKTQNLYSGPYSEDFVVHRGDILVGMDGDFNVSKWKGNDGLLNQRVCRLMLESSGYSSEFFFYCLQPYLNAINQETSSVTVKHLSSRTINQIPLPLPPLPEQRAIVSKIEQLFSELDNGIANLNTAKQKLEVYRQAVLKKAFEGELTREWREQQTDLPSGEELLVQIQEERERYYEEQMAQWQEEVAKWEENGKVGKKPGKPRKLKDDFSLFNQEELYSIPKYWKFVLPQQLCSLQKYSIGIGPFGSNLKVSDYTDEGVPLVFVRNITRNSFDRNLKFISQEKFLDLIPHSVHPGDILVTKMGDPPGDVTIYPNGKPIGIITSDCLKFRPLEGFADNKFYKYYLESVFTKK